MKQILLHGLLRKLACAKFNVKASCFQDLLNSLSANFPKLRKYAKTLKNNTSGFLVVVDGKLIDNFKNIDSYIKNSKIIELIPVTIFSGLITASMITAIGLAAAGSTAAVVIAAIASVLVVSLISFGISFLVAKLLTPKDPRQVKTSSFIFTSKENSVARNTPIAIGYGKLRVGSSLVSSIAINFDIDLVKNINGAEISTNSGAAGGGSGFSSGIITNKLN